MPGRGFGGFTSFKDRSVDLDSLCPIIGSSTADKRDLDELLNSFNIVELEEESEQQEILDEENNEHQQRSITEDSSKSESAELTNSSDENGLDQELFSKQKKVFFKTFFANTCNISTEKVAIDENDDEDELLGPRTNYKPQKREAAVVSSSSEVTLGSILQH